MITKIEKIACMLISVRYYIKLAVLSLDLAKTRGNIYLLDDQWSVKWLDLHNFASHLYIFVQVYRPESKLYFKKLDLCV